MEIKTITYQRVLNVGNYESKRLEMTAEIDDGDDLEFETSFLMEMVERKVREEAHKAVEEEMRQLRQELRELRKEQQAVKASLEPQKEGDPDDIPFDVNNNF